MTRFAGLMGLATLAAFVSVSTAAAVCIALAWPGIERALSRFPSAARARALFLVRIAPTLFGALAGALTTIAFLRHEPSSTAEAPGWFMGAAASAGAGLILRGLCRVIRQWKSTNRFLHVIQPSATRVTVPGVSLPTWQVDIAFPLVAVAGVWRSRLLVARRVLEQMPRDEFEVVLKHELAHARHRDNAARLIVTGLPDVLGLLERRLGLERAWREAAEDAADDFAAAGNARARACLAAALIRVANIAGTQARACVPLPAFHGGESIERRVRRLLDAGMPRSRAPWAMRASALLLPLACAAAVFIQWDVVLSTVHGITEAVVRK